MRAFDVTGVSRRSAGSKIARQITHDTARSVTERIIRSDRAAIGSGTHAVRAGKVTDDAAHVCAGVGIDVAGVAERDRTGCGITVPVTNDTAHAVAAAKNGIRIGKISAERNVVCGITYDTTYAAARFAGYVTGVRASVQGKRAVVAAYDTTRISISAYRRSRDRTAVGNDIRAVADRDGMTADDITYDTADTIRSLNLATV